MKELDQNQFFFVTVTKQKLTIYLLIIIKGHYKARQP